MLQFQFQGADAVTQGVSVVNPIASVFDAALDNSNKTFTVPAGEMWKLNWAHITLISTATVGNRQMEMQIFDASNNLMMSVSAGTTQAASLTRDYHFMQGTDRETAFVASELQTPFPADLYLPAGWKIRFRDSAAIAAAADDMTVAMQYQRFKGC